MDIREGKKEVRENCTLRSFITLHQALRSNQGERDERRWTINSFWHEKLKGSNHLQDLAIDGRRLIYRF
jgi:hypothetical protein